MQESLNTSENEINPTTETATELASRRAFLARFGALGAGLVALQLSARAQDAMGQTTPGTMSPGTAAPGAMPMADPAMPGMMPAMTPRNEMQYRQAVAPVAMLSLETSRIASLKAVDPAVRQFATFELAEAIAVTNFLKDMKTPMPPMSAMDRETLSRAQNTPAGPDFDRDYITKQRDSHIYLRDTASNYLATPLPGRAKAPEVHGRHIATIQLPTFVEHTTHTQDILGRMTA